jgi:hypothetical protein
MKKKLFSLIMAVAMIAALTVPSFAGSVTSTSISASGTGSQSGNVNLTGNTALPVVKVTFPNAGYVILNPYKMTVADAGNSTAVASTDTIDDQILSATHQLKNETEAPMKVGIKITGTPSTGVELATKACSGKETTKSVFMFAELLYAGTSTKTAQDLKALWTAPADVNDKCFPQIIASTEEKENQNFFTVPAAASGSANYLYWTIRGNAATAPAEKWTASDTVGANVVFTFTPDVLTSIDLITNSEDNTVTDNIGVIELGKDLGDGTLVTALTDSDGNYGAAMGTVVRIVPAPASDPADSTKKAGVISAVEVKDSTGAKVTATKVNANLYYFVATAPSNPVTVKITGTART